MNATPTSWTAQSANRFWIGVVAIHDAMNAIEKTWTRYRLNDALPESSRTRTGARAAKWRISRSNQKYPYSANRVSIHGVDEILLDRQADAVGLELEKLFIPENCSDEDYDRLMRRMLEKYSEKGVSAAVFGDIFLEDLRKYRTEKLSLVNMDALFPLWGQDTGELAEEFIALGFKAIVTCVDTEFLDKKFTGREFDRKFLSDLPDSVDPCGENGEFHTFAYDGPIFSEPIPYRKGRIVLREERFSYCDLVPLENGRDSNGEI